MRRPKFAESITPAEIDGLLDALREDATRHNDPAAEPGLTRDPKDDYLVALAVAVRADWIVSGDRHLLELEAPEVPILSPRDFLDRY